MRSAMLGDVIAAARVMLALPPEEHFEAIDRMLYEAHVADLCIKRLGRPHPLWGNGSLLGRAAQLPQVREPFASDPAYLLALRVVIDGLLRRRSVFVTYGVGRNRGTVEAASSVV